MTRPFQQYLSALDLRRKLRRQTWRRHRIRQPRRSLRLPGTPRSRALGSEEEAVKSIRDLRPQRLALGNSGRLRQRTSAGGPLRRRAKSARGIPQCRARIPKRHPRSHCARIPRRQSFYRGDFKSAATLYDQSLQSAQHTSDAHQLLMPKSISPSSPSNRAAIPPPRRRCRNYRRRQFHRR